MRECPDIDVLIEVSAGSREAAAALLKHTEVCDHCRSDLEVLSEMREAFDPHREVPEALVAQVMMSLPDPAPEPEPAAGRPGWSPLDMAISFVLGTATVAAALFAGTPAEAMGPLTDVILFSSAMGLIVSVVEPHVSR